MLKVVFVLRWKYWRSILQLITHFPKTFEKYLHYLLLDKADIVDTRYLHRVSVRAAVKNFCNFSNSEMLTIDVHESCVTDGSQEEVWALTIKQAIHR